MTINLSMLYLKGIKNASWLEIKSCLVKMTPTRKRAAVKGCFFSRMESTTTASENHPRFFMLRKLGVDALRNHQGKGGIERTESYTHFYNIRLYIIYILYIALYL